MSLTTVIKIYKELGRIDWEEVDFSIGLSCKNFKNLHLSPICVFSIYNC